MESWEGNTEWGPIPGKWDEWDALMQDTLAMPKGVSRAGDGQGVAAGNSFPKSHPLSASLAASGIISPLLPSGPLQRPVQTEVNGLIFVKFQTKSIKREENPPFWLV